MRYAAVVAILIALRAAAFAQDITISGRVIAEGTGEPIPIAKVWIYSSAGQLAAGPEAVNLNGEFQITLRSYRGGAVRCEISAEPLYERLRLTLPVMGGQVSAKQIRMKRTLTLKLSKASHSRSANGQQQSLDFIATNEAQGALTISALRLQGSVKRSTECADPTPGVIFEISDAGEGSGQSSVNITIPGRPFRDHIAIDGRLTFLGCEQIRMDFSIPWKVQVAPGESMKLRVTLPRKVRQKGGRSPKSLELEKWEVVALRVQLEGGRLIDTSLEER